MKNLDFREVYKRVFSLFTLEGAPQALLQKVIAGSDKAQDYEEAVRSDKFLTTKLCAIASEGLKAGNISSLSHGMALIGLQKVRNAVFGHSLRRIFDPQADSLFTNLDDAEKFLKYSLAAEELAKKVGCEYKGMAFASGLMFDIFANWMAKETDLQASCTPIFESTWKHGATTAALSWALANHESILISHKKMIFSAGMLHEIGRLALAFFAPTEYALCEKKFVENKKMNALDDRFLVDIERENFDLSHMEIGASLVFQLRPLREVEILLDFHHDPVLLKTRNPDAFLGVAIINLADRLAWHASVQANVELSAIKKILEGHTQHIPLNDEDLLLLFNQTKAKGVLTL